MPSLRPDSSLCEYTFSEEEAIAAKILTPLQVMWFQTKYALLFKQKASQLIPENAIDDRQFLLKMGNIEGELSALQSIIQDSHEAQSQQVINNARPLSQQQAASVTEIKSVSDRASQLVHELD